MTIVRTRDEALAAVDHGLAQWAAIISGTLTQAEATVRAASAEAQQQLRRWTARVSALEALIAAMPPDDHERAAAAADLIRARDVLQTVILAATQIDSVAGQFARLRRAQVRDTDARIAAARADLTRRGGGLVAYRAAGSRVDPGSAAAGGLATTGSSAGAGAWLTSRGMTEFTVADVDFSDNPIIGPVAREGSSRADYRWAVETWDQVIRPGVQRGMTRDDFAALDAQRGAAPGRRTAAVYDLFLGDRAIKLVRRADGTLTPDGGRRRITIARELGIGRLPGKVIEP